MRLFTILRRAALVSLAVLATVASAYAADMVFSTGSQFIAGPRLTDGSDLNVMVGRVNGISNGSYAGAYNGTIGAITPSTGAFTSTTATTGVGFPAPTSCSGTTTAACAGQVNLVSVTGLTTAAGASSAAMVVTNAYATATSTILCNPQDYAGTGTPVAAAITRVGAGSYSFKVANVIAGGGAALNATVVMACMVFN